MKFIDGSFNHECVRWFQSICFVLAQSVGNNGRHVKYWQTAKCVLIQNMKDESQVRPRGKVSRDPAQFHLPPSLLFLLLLKEEQTVVLKVWEINSFYSERGEVSSVFVCSLPPHHKLKPYDPGVH